MYTRKSLPRPAAGSGAPKPKNGNATVVYSDDILSFPDSDQNGVKTVGNLVLKTGAAMYRIYLTDDSQKGTHTIEGDSDAEGFLKKYEGKHPGDSLEASEFVQNSIGIGLILIIDAECGSNIRKLIGTPCSPLYLKGEFTDDKDGAGHMMQFEQRRRDRNVAKFYDGSLSFAANFVAALAVVVNDANGAVYQLPVSNTASQSVSISNTSVLPSRKVISLIGGGGTNPATLAAGTSGPVTVVLEGGTSWSALQDSVINLMVVDGGATKYLVEVSRK